MKYLPAANVKVVAALRLFDLRIYSLQGCAVVGNGLDRSGIGVLTATLYKIRIE